MNKEKANMYTGISIDLFGCVFQKLSLPGNSGIFLLFFVLVFISRTPAQVYNGNLLLSSQAEIDAFNYTQITGNLRIQEQTPGSIKNLDGLSEITSIQGSLFIVFNAALTDLDGLSNLNFIGTDLIISSNHSLKNINAFSKLKTIKGALSIGENESLANLMGISNLTAIGGYFNIVNNDALVNINELCKLTCVSNAISIFDNDMLLNINGLTGIKVAKDLFIQENDALENLDGLSGLKSVTETLSIINNDALTRVDGLSNLNTIGSVLSISDNNILSNIDGLNNLVSVANILLIISNNALTNINGLSNLQIVQELIIRNNLKLSKFCGLFNLLSSNGLSGSYNVSGNALNPSQQEVIDGGPCALYAFQSYMMLWAISNVDQNQSILSYYSLAEGNTFKNVEGDIAGYSGVRNIEDLTIDNGGNFWFLNNSLTSMIYKINPEQIDFDPSTPITSKQIGRTRTLLDEKPVQLSNIRFIKGKLYGLDIETNRLYDIDTFDATVTELAVLNNVESKATGFTLAADGNVYLLKSKEAGESELWKFEGFPTGNLSLIISLSSLDNIQSITAHPNGNLYVSDSKNLYEINLNEKTIGILPNHEVDVAGMDFNFHKEKNTDPVSTLNFENLPGVTSVNNLKENIPTEYRLLQNYPNPFNPNTAIRYSLPEISFVKLKVYNTLGEIVRTLINENLEPGEYEIIFDASELPSGIYIYKIEAAGFTSSGKMILMK